MIPHYKRVKPGINKQDPVFLNLYDVTFQLPAAIGDGEDLSVFCKSVGLPTEPELQTVEQKYKYSTRSYTTFPDTTSIEIPMTFDVNINQENSAYAYKKLKELYRLSFNPQTGLMTRKRDHVCTITVDIHTRDFELIRRVVLRDCEIKSISQMDLSFDSGDPFECETAWTCDDYDDLDV